MYIVRDIQYALRLMAKNPAFTAMTIAVMTIGLSLFTFNLATVHTLYYKPLPHPGAENLIQIGKTINGQPQNRNRPNTLDYRNYVENSNTVANITSLYTQTATMTDGYKSVRHQGVYVTSSFFEVMNVAPIKGRLFTEQEDKAGAKKVAIISYELWQNYFAKQENIIGTKVKINYESTEIVGVMPKGYLFPWDNHLWIPAQIDANTVTAANARDVVILATLNHGYSIEEANSELNTLTQNYYAENSNNKQNIGAYTDYFKKFSAGTNTTSIIVLMTISGLFVLTLCAINVGNLLLIRAIKRQKETAIRVALGAPRIRLIMQTMIESTLICLFSALFTILLVGWAMEQATQSFLQEFPYWIQLSLTPELALMAFMCALTTALIMGIIPALKASGGSFNNILKDNAKTSISKSASRTVKILVSVEIALSCALMTASAVIFILLQQAISSGYGVNIDNYLVTRINPLKPHYSSDQDLKRYFSRVINDVSKLPGISKATLISQAPTEWPIPVQVEPEGQTFVDNDYLNARELRITLNSFEVLGLDLVEGRNIRASDDATSTPVVIISEATAKKFWPNDSALGKRLRLVEKEEKSEWLTVIGVSRNIVFGSPFNNRLEMPTLYIPYQQKPRDAMAILVKTEGDPLTIRPAIETALARIDPNVASYSTATLQQQAKRNRSFREFITLTFLIVAIGALIMASTGIYSVMASHINQRIQELGVRRALGASEKQILLLLIKKNGLQLFGGFAIGLPLAYIMSQQFVQMMGSISSTYLIAYAVIPIIICAVVLASTILPALKAIKLTPASALRHD